MDCSEFEIRLAERLDLRQDLQSAGLHVHAESCESCRQSLLDAKILLQGVAAWRQSLQHFHVLERISITELTRSIEQSPTAEKVTAEKVVVRKADDRVRSGFLAWGLVGTSAAALCFMFGSAAFQQNSPLGQHRLVSRHTDNSAERIAHEITHKNHENNVQTDASVPTTAKPDLETVIASAGHAYSQLAQESAAAAKDFALLMPSRSLFTVSELPNSEDTAPNPGNSPAPAKSNPMFPGTVYPVGDSVENALQFLWKSVPGMDRTTG
jgi:hypothetical protein